METILLYLPAILHFMSEYLLRPDVIAQAVILVIQIIQAIKINNGKITFNKT